MKLEKLYHSSGVYVKYSSYLKICKERNALLLEIEKIKDEHKKQDKHIILKLHKLHKSLKKLGAKPEKEKK